MHNKLALLLTLALLAATAVSAQVTVTDTHEGGKPVPKPAPFNMKSAQNVSTLGNRNIIQMVKSGTQENTILAAIRSRRGSFDLSPQGCSALHAANVSQNVLNAMGGGKSPCNSSLPNPAAGQNQTYTGGMLLGNRDTTLLGNGGAQATATPSNGGDPVSLNPQPLPPTGKTLLQSSTPASTATPAGTAQRATQMKLQPAGAASIAPAQSKASKGRPSTPGTAAPPQ